MRENERAKDGTETNKHEQKEEGKQQISLNNSTKMIYL